MTTWFVDILGAWLLVSVFVSLGLARAIGLSHRGATPPVRVAQPAPRHRRTVPA